MSEHRTHDRPDTAAADAPADTRHGGWWSKIIPRFLGVAPVAVWGAELEDDDSPQERPQKAVG
jgi:hypothetical protein